MHFGDGTSEPFDLLAVVPPARALRRGAVSGSQRIRVDTRGPAHPVH